MATNEQTATSEAMRDSLERIRAFVSTQEFRGLLDELYSQPEETRWKFVNEVVLDQQELAKREIRVPDGLVVQRSAFADNRPTLFCVTAKLPDGRVWEKVTFTFDNASDQFRS